MTSWYTFQIAANVVRSGVWQLCMTFTSAILKGDLVGLCVIGNWLTWVSYCGSETVSIHLVGEGTVGFSDVESIALIILELVDSVYRLAVRMCSEFCTGIGRMVNETSIAPGSVAGSGASGGGRTVGVETWVNNKLAEVGKFSESDRGRFGEETLG